MFILKIGEWAEQQYLLLSNFGTFSHPGNSQAE